MICPKCNSENVSVQMVNTIRLCLILCTCGLWLLVPSRKGNTKIKSKSVAICQNCGHNWNV